MDRWIYKVCSRLEWSEAERQGGWLGSADDRRDGFVHFSTARQLAATLAKHFAGQSGLVLVKLDSLALAPGLKWEASRGGDLFPHLYGALDPSHALSVQPLPLGADGRHELPKDLT